MDNFIAPADDGVWKIWTPPSGYRCRCIRIALSAAEARARGWNGSTQPVPSNPDDGWGHHPLDGDLGDVFMQRLANANPKIADAIKQQPTTWQEYVKHGKDIVDNLPDIHSLLTAERFHNKLMEKLRKEVGIDGVEAKVTGTGAAMVRKASRYFPDTWVAAANNIGSLSAKASTAKDARGVAYTLSRDYLFGFNLRGYGAVKSAQKSDSFLSTPKNSMRTAIHEYAHILQEKVGGLDDIFQALHVARTQNDKLKFLAQLQPRHGYGKDEVTKEDGYANPYQGREYSHTPTRPALEVLTMALETVLGAQESTHGKPVAHSLRDLQLMYEKDRQMVELVIGLLFNFK
jgi:hypothetical protein